MADDLIVNDRVTIPAAELEWTFTTSSGPGGQHANRANTRVALQFDIGASQALDDSVRSRLLSRLGPVVRVVADDERSQYRNRRIATERLAVVLRRALHEERERRPTKPSRSSVRRRLDAKSRRSQRKKSRGTVDPGDW